MRWLVVFLLAVGMASPVVADELGEAQRHYIKGTKAFDLGAYDEAIAEYSAAYRIKDDPALLYNLGQTHRLANHPAEALHFYKMYLTKVPDAPNREEVRAKIAELEHVVEQQHAAEREKREEQRRTPPPPSTPLPPAASPTVTVTSSHPSDQRPARRTMLFAGVTLASIGVAAIAGGIACGILAKQNSDDLTRLGEMMQSFDSSKQRAGKTEQALEGALLGLGAAAAVTGTILVLVGRSSSRAGARASVAPVIGVNSGGMAATVKF